MLAITDGLKDRNLPEIAESFETSLEDLPGDTESSGKLPSFLIKHQLTPARLRTGPRRGSDHTDLRSSILEAHHARPV